VSKLRRRTRHRSHKPEISIHRVRFTPIDDEVRGRLEHALGISLSAQQRGGPGCLNSFSASISGASAKVRLPSGVAAG
jgi:hypothetical protein